MDDRGANVDRGRRRYWPHAHCGVPQPPLWLTHVAPDAEPVIQNIVLLENTSLAVRALIQGIRTEQDPAVVVPAVKHLHILHDIFYKVPLLSLTHTQMSSCADVLRSSSSRLEVRSTNRLRANNLVFPSVSLRCNVHFRLIDCQKEKGVLGMAYGVVKRC